MLICLAMMHIAGSTAERSAAPAFADLVSEFDPALPGYGYDRAGATQKTIQEMALGTYLVATETRLVVSDDVKSAPP